MRKRKRFTQADWDAAEVWWEITWDRKMRPARVVRETAQTLVVLEPDCSGTVAKYYATRQRKGHTQLGGTYHRTWSEARDALLAALEAAVAGSQRYLAEMRTQLGEVRAMSEPAADEAPS